jgi:hypothetical protein
MSREPWRYLRWWFSNEPGNLIVAGLFSIFFGPSLLVASAMGSDVESALLGLVIFIIGLWVVLVPWFGYRASSRSDPHRPRTKLRKSD